MTELQAGRELDTLIAEKIFQKQKCDKWQIWGHGLNGPEWINTECKDEHDCYPINSPTKYSSNIAAAWEIIIEMGKRGFWYTFQNFDVYGRGILTECTFIVVDNDGNYDYWTADAETVELAICLAALKALGIEAGNDN